MWVKDLKLKNSVNGNLFQIPIQYLEAENNLWTRYSIHYADLLLQKDHE